MASRALQKIRVVRPQVIKVRSAPPAKKRRGRRRSGGSLLGGVGSGVKSLLLPALGAFIGARVAGQGADIPLASTFGSKKIALTVLMWGAGHFGRMPLLKQLAIGPASAAAWEYATTGQVSGDDDVEGDDMEGDDE